MIGGVLLQKRFGIELQWIGFNRIEIPHHVYELEAKFAGKVTDQQRLKHAMECFKFQNNSILKEIVSEYKNIFLANE